jgi:hypothetical protein
MGNLWRLLEWIGLALGFVMAGIVVQFAVTRRRILRHVEEALGKNAPLLTTGARVGANGSAERGRPSVSGMLILLDGGLYFRSWFGGREVFVPGPSISWIGVSEAPDTHRRDRHRIVVRFLNAEGKEAGIAIQLLYPEQWVAAIKTHLITRAE